MIRHPFGLGLALFYLAALSLLAYVLFDLLGKLRGRLYY